METKLIKALAPTPHWLCWRGEPVTNKRTGETKVTKKPMYGVHDVTGRWVLHYAKTNDPTTWGTYEQAAEWLKVLKAERKGLGFVLTLDGGNGCIDLDHCLDSSTRKFKDDEAGKTAARVMEILTREGVEPCSEVSQSGEGLHIWGKFDLPPEKVKGIRNKYIEMYRAGRFIAMTGDAYHDAGIHDIQPAVDEIIKEFHLMDEVKAPAPATMPGTAAGASPTMEDRALIEVIKKSKQGEKFHKLYDLGEMGAYGNDHSSADAALISMLAYYTKDPEQLKRLFLSSALGQDVSRKKHHEGDYLDRTIKKALTKVIDGYNPKEYAARKQAEELNRDFDDALISGGEEEPERKAPENTPFLEMLRRFKKNDSENADTLAALCKGKFLYCTDLKTWLKYDGKKWRPVTPVELQEPARAAVKHALASLARGYAIFTEGGGTLDADNQKKYSRILDYLNGKAQDNISIQNSIRLAAGKPGTMCQAADFDRDPYLLNCDNGVLNLKTGELIPHNPKHRFMKCTRAAYDGKSHSTLWSNTMRQIVPDAHTRDYVQRMAGYCLYGGIREQKLFFLFGRGGTGKGTFIETLGRALGDYATSIPVEILLSSRSGRDGNNATPEKAKLKGVRLALTSESGIDNSFDDGTLKLLTGGDEITARPLHSNPITFSPSHKLVGSSNYMPSIKDVTDEGIKRRLVIIPFHGAFKRDNTLRPRLEEPENLADCLLWAYEGYRKWQEMGLDEDTYSQEIAAANKTYYIENDFIGEFLDGSCDIGPDYRVDAHELYDRYKNFANSTGATLLSRSKFTRAMTHRLEGGRVKSNGRVYITGLKMKDVSEF